MSERNSNNSTKNNSTNSLIQLDSQKISLLDSIISNLELIIEENKKLNNYQKIIKLQRKLIFSSLKYSKISLSQYIKRINKYTEMGESTFIIALIYIDRICELSNIILTPFNIHRLICTSVIIAIKYNEDIIYENSFYADIFGIDSEELILLELKFLELINFNLFIHTKQFNQYQNYLIKLMELKKD
jgi:hypothetical protein